MIFKPTNRFGIKNNICDIERRLSIRTTGNLYVVQIYYGTRIYNLIVPVYLMVSLGTRGVATLVEERRTTARDYMKAQRKCKPLPGNIIEQRENKRYEIISNPDKYSDYPVLMVDNY